MGKTNVPDHALTDASDTVLIIIDVQKEFLDKMAPEQWLPIVNRIGWIVEIAGRMKVPIVVTAENTGRNDATIPQVSEKLPPGTTEYNKMSFGLTGEPDIMAAIEGTHRKTAVLAGLETDVCVCQSALGLLQKNYRVVVLADAVASPGPSHEFGIERMRNAGVIISSVKGIFYEWVRTVQRCDLEFKDVYNGKQPDGIYL